MRENIKFEVAIEVISMYIAIAKKNGDIEKLMKLIKEREKIYLGDINLVNKVIKEHGNCVKKRLKTNYES